MDPNQTLNDLITAVVAGRMTDASLLLEALTHWTDVQHGFRPKDPRPGPGTVVVNGDLLGALDRSLGDLDSWKTIAEALHLSERLVQTSLHPAQAGA